jgi:hypothetical protein
MKHHLKPNLEALLAGIVMLFALAVLGFVVAHNYAGRLRPGEVDGKYRAPLVKVRAVGNQIKSHLGAHVPLENLDKLYQERTLILPEEPTEDVSVVDKLADTIPAEFNLTGIAWNEHQPVAFINGRGVVRGDSFDKWFVSEINQESVLLKDRDGNQKQLDLFGGTAQ